MRTLVLIAALGLSAPLIVPAHADEVRLQENAPDRHVVVKGDTLWDISAKFLKDPWRWPEVWRLNQEQIKNPHLIYPGDVVVLSMEDGKPRLSLEGSGLPLVKLSPQVRSEPIETREQGIPPIQPAHIQPYVMAAGIVDEAALNSAPKILGAADQRVMITQGDVVYAGAGKADTQHWKVVRAGKPLTDPDTGELLGLEAQSVGRARTLAPGDPQTLRMERVNMEVTLGDRLVADAPHALHTMTPRAPDKPVRGKIIQAYGGFNATAQYATVVVNRGLRDGLEPGHVLAIHRQGRLLPGEKAPTGMYSDTKCVKPGKTVTSDFYDPKEMLVECGELPADAPRQVVRYADIGCLKPGARITANEFFDPKEVYQLHCRAEDRVRNQVQLPNQNVGLLFVYRVFDKAAYGLIMRADGPVYLMDSVASP